MVCGVKGTESDAEVGCDKPTQGKRGNIHIDGMCSAVGESGGRVMAEAGHFLFAPHVALPFLPIWWDFGKKQCFGLAPLQVVCLYPAKGI
jgi:hypothetical protein